MRVLAVCSFLVLSIGLGYSFRITELLEPFNEGRQGDSDVEEQILPVFAVAFIATAISNILGSIKPKQEEQEWHWCYDDPSCDEDAWKSQAKFMCNGIRNSPINIDFNTGATGMWMEEPQAVFSSPLQFTGYGSVRYVTIGNEEEHLGSQGPESRANKLSNKGGHTAQIDVAWGGVGTPPAGVGELSGGPLAVPYNILQLHFHWGSDLTKGSEHTYGGVQFPLEMHIVHVKSGTGLGESDLSPFNYIDGLAVTGFMFNPTSSSNPALQPIISALSDITGYGDSIGFSSFDLEALISPAMGGRYATYQGGLTTPTCNEVVRWINMEQPLDISEAQLAVFRTLLDKHGNNIVNNFRSPQDLGGRTVRVIQP